MYQKKKLGRWTYFALALLVLLPTLFAVIPSRIASAETKNPYDIYAEEYKAFVAIKVVQKCMDTTGSGWYAGRKKDESNPTWGFSGSSEVNTGFVSGIGGDDFQIGCWDESDMGSVAKAIGFDSLDGLREAIWPSFAKNPTKAKSCDDLGVPSSTGNRLCSTATDLPGLRKVLEEQVKAKDRQGPDNNASKLSGEAELWFWDNVYRKDPGDFGGCGGVFTSDLARAQGTVKEKRLPSSVKADGSDPEVYAYTKPSDGEYAKYKYAIFKVALDKTIEKTGSDLAEIRNSAINCQDVIAKLTNAGSVDKVRAALETFFLTCTDSNTCGPSTAGNPSGSSEDGNNPEIKFQCSVSANPITWIMCALIEGFATAIDTLDAQVTEMLDIKSDTYFGDDATGQNFKEVWSTIRTISAGFLIIMALVMIISTALSFGPFDAYTVKKVMPRLITVVILISISWPLVKFLIDMSDLMGYAVRGLIQAPFVNSGAVSLDGGQTTISAVALVGSGLVLGLPGLLSFMVTGFMAVMVAFLTLILRQILIILLAVIVPIALVSYVLPNTAKFGKFWWDAFSKALLVFPIIAGFIAIGRVFAVVAYNSGANGDNAGTVRVFIAFIAYYAPYFLIPQAFKMAGGLLGNLSGMVNDRSRGAFDRLKNFRKTQSATNMGKMKTGDRFQGNNRIARQFNQRTSGIAGGWRGSHFGVGQRGEAYHDLHARAAAQDALKNNHLLQQLAFDDNANAVMALSGGTAAGAERASRILARENGWTEQERIRAMEGASAVGFNNSNGLAAIQTMAQNKSRALTGALSGEAGMALVQESVAQLSGGNARLANNTMGNFAYHSRNAGRLDFGGENPADSIGAGWGRASVAQHAQSHTASLEAFGNHFINELGSGDQDRVDAAAIALMEMQSMLPNATAENQAVINETLARAGIDHSATRVQTVQRTNPDGSPMLNNGQPVYTQTTAPVSVDEQLAALTGPNGLSERDIRGRARTYDAQTPVAAQAGGPPVAPPPPPTTP